MAERSAFRDFIRELRKAWRITFPWIRPLENPLGPWLPKASTFYAGVARAEEMHVFLNFQHSPKAWEVGQFTINVILSKRLGPPAGGGWRSAPEGEVYEGSHRIGSLLGGKDKWWHLKHVQHGRTPLGTEAWRPTGYEDDEAVLREAVADVSRDVRAVLLKLGIPEASGRADT